MKLITINICKTSDIGINNNLFGGTMLSWLDEAGAIMDTNVRNRASDLLTVGFGKRTLDQCREEKGEVYNKARVVLVEEFAEFGITISQFGLAGGLTYDPEIQNKIDEEFKTKNQKKINQNKYEANEITRKDELAEANNRLAIAKKYAQALEAEEQKTMLEVQLTLANAMKISAGKGQKIVPDMVTDGSKFLFQPKLSK